MTAISVRHRVSAAVAALALLTGGAVVAAQNDPTATGAASAPATSASSEQGIRLAQYTVPTLPELRVGTAFTLDLKPIIEQLKREAGYPNAAVTVRSITGLPAGLTWAPSTNVVSGTPTAAGTFTVTLDARGCVAILCRSLTESMPFTVQPAAGGTTTPTSTTSTPSSSTPSTSATSTPTTSGSAPTTTPGSSTPTSSTPTTVPTPGGPGSVDTGSVDTGSIGGGEGSTSFAGIDVGSLALGGLLAFVIAYALDGAQFPGLPMIRIPGYESLR